MLMSQKSAQNFSGIFGRSPAQFLDGSFPIPAPDLVTLFLGILLRTPVSAVAMLGPRVFGSMVTQRDKLAIRSRPGLD